VALCPYCNQQVGWFEKAHEACVQLYKQKALQAEQARLQRQQEEERERLQRETLEREQHEYQVWRSQNDPLIEKFLEIAERKVSLLDDYGDENWNALTKEIEVVLSKVAKLQNDNIDPIRGLLFKDQLPKAFDIRPRSGQSRRSTLATFQKIKSPLFRKYCSLKHHLEIEFRQYHEAPKGQQPKKNLSEFSGTEFEIYLARLLKANGFAEVCGTPASGDQGADLIAKRNGRTIVIQAKRYQGSVGNRAVQEVVGAVNFYGADEAWVITSGTFTPSAKALAQKNSVRLIDGHALQNGEFPVIDV
jgi:hypothetical protein